MLMSVMKNHLLFHSLTFTRIHLDTDTWYCMILHESVLGTTAGIRSVPIKVPALVPIPVWNRAPASVHGVHI